MYELPTEIELGNIQYGIRNRGDYRVVLDIFSCLEDPELDSTERIISALIIFYEDLNSIEDVYSLPNIEEAVHKMYDFFNGEPQPKPAMKTHRKLIDWEGDEAIIVSAINNVAKAEIRALDYLHWWTFLSYYMSIGESTLSTVVSIRDKTAKGEKLEKWERKYKQKNPQYFIWKSKTADEIDAENWLKSVWNKE
jgi:hypothetical protein